MIKGAALDARNLRLTLSNEFGCFALCAVSVVAHKDNLAFFLCQRIESQTEFRGLLNIWRAARESYIFYTIRRFIFKLPCFAGV